MTMARSRRPFRAETVRLGVAIAWPALIHLRLEHMHYRMPDRIFLEPEA